MIKNLFIFLIKLYQKYLSPLKTTRCPYIPTCSQYGLEAIQKYGALKGGLLLLDCKRKHKKINNDGK